MPAIKHIEGLQTELTNLTYTNAEASVSDRVGLEYITINMHETHKYEAIPLDDYKSGTDYTIRFSPDVGIPNNHPISMVIINDGTSTIAFDSNFVVIGTINNSSHVIQYIHIIPTAGKAMVFITSE